MSGVAFPFVNQNKKAAKLPEMLLESLCPFSALRYMSFSTHHESVTKTNCNLVTWAIPEKKPNKGGEIEDKLL